MGSSELFDRAKRVLPGGVNSPVRAFRAVGGTPFFVARGHGSSLADVDGREYVDYVCSWGALILGHAHPAVLAAIRDAAERGWTYGAPCPAEVELAEAVRRRMPSLEMMRFVNSGTEATMAAVRLARAATGRDLIIKFEGCYHGHADGFLVKAGSGVATLGLPDSPGVPSALANLTLTAPFNDATAIADLFRAHAKRIAAVIVEPYVGNAGFIPPDPDFHPALRTLCDDHGALLIFDEVQTGMGRTGELFAYQRTGVEPDIMALAKALGGGFPVGAFLSTKEAGEGMTPGTHGSTFGGNPLAMAAGNATLDVMLADGFLDRVKRIGLLFKQRLAEIKDRFPSVVAEVRGEGLLLGLRCVMPNSQLVEALRDEHLLAVAAGDNVVRLVPPLIVGETDVGEAMGMLERACARLVHVEQPAKQGAVG